MKRSQKQVVDKKQKSKEIQKPSLKQNTAPSASHGIQVPSQKLRFKIEAKDQQSSGSGSNKRFKINLKAISESHKNKMSMRFHDIDRQFVCRKTKEQRGQMGIEYEGIKLVDIYTKSNPNKVSQKYGKQLVIRLVFNHENEPTIKRKVAFNKDYKAPEITQEDELEEEKLLDEHKLFQTLHESLTELQKKYNKTTEQISELFLRVCGDLDMVEAALLGKTVPEWTYLEDLALTKSIETTEYQWLLKQKGQAEINKRRRFLLTADTEDNCGQDVGMKDECADGEDNEETVGYV